MASSRIDGALPPTGHFDLPLPIDTPEIARANAGYKRELFEYHLTQKQNYCANCNLLGMLAFAERNDSGALKYFKMALDEDPENLNAVVNIKYVTAKYPKKVKESAQATADTSTMPDLSTNKGRVRKARCYAEQAYAYVHLYQETVTTDRYERYRLALRLYNEAMKLAGGLDATSKVEWMFSSGFASLKIMEIMLIRKDAREVTEALQDVAKRFGDVLNGKLADEALKCKALMHVATAFHKASRLIVINPKCIPPNLTTYIARPEKCLHVALESSPDDTLTAKILVPLAQLRKRPDRGGSFEEAKQLLDKSISLERSKFNFLAYSSRAALCITQYRRTKDIALIKDAQKDLEFILPKHESPWDYEWLAEVYYHRAKTITGKESREYIVKALETCDKCEKCQDGAKRSGLHHIRGKILCFTGQHRKARESFQKGVECEERTGWNSGNEEALAEEKTHL